MSSFNRTILWIFTLGLTLISCSGEESKSQSTGVLPSEPSLEKSTGILPSKEEVLPPDFHQLERTIEVPQSTQGKKIEPPIPMEQSSEATDDRDLIVGLFRNADLVLKGVIMSLRYELHEGLPVSVLRIKVEERVKGLLPKESETNNEITVVYQGGMDQKTGEVSVIQGCPHLFFKGLRYLMFIKGNGQTRCPFLESGVFQIYSKDSNDYLFDLHSFPLKSLASRKINDGPTSQTFDTNLKQNQLVLNRMDSLFKDREKNESVVIKGESYCDCVKFGYNYQELAEHNIQNGIMSKQLSQPERIRAVMPSDSSFGLTFDEFKRDLQTPNQSSKSLADAVKIENGTFENYTGKLKISLKSQVTSPNGRVIDEKEMTYEKIHIRSPLQPKTQFMQ